MLRNVLSILLNNQSEEVMEFDTIDEAEEMRNRFEINSDSGHRYILKKIGGTNGTN